MAGQKSARTRRPYRLDVAHFMRTLGIATPDQLRQVDHRAVIAWERLMREQDGAAASTVRRRLSALSSLFKHLVRHGATSRNLVVAVSRPAINHAEGHGISAGSCSRMASSRLKRAGRSSLPFVAACRISGKVALAAATMHTAGQFRQGSTS